MTITTHSACITGPVPYRAASGHKGNIPLGPCLLERLDNQWIDIVWGARGQRSAALAVEDIEAAQQHGHLILLD